MHIYIYIYIYIYINSCHGRRMIAMYVYMKYISCFYVCILYEYMCMYVYIYTICTMFVDMSHVAYVMHTQQLRWQLDNRNKKNVLAD